MTTFPAETEYPDRRPRDRGARRIYMLALFTRFQKAAQQDSVACLARNGTQQSAAARARAKSVAAGQPPGWDPIPALHQHRHGANGTAPRLHAYRSEGGHKPEHKYRQAPPYL